MTLFQLLFASFSSVIAFFFIGTGLYVIQQRRGALLTYSRSRYIATGSYAIWVGIGQIIMGVGFLIFASAFLWDIGLGFLSVPFLMVVVIIGGIVHSQGRKDPDIRALIQADQEYNQARDKDQAIQRIRRQKLTVYVLISVISGAAITGFLFLDQWSVLTQQSFEKSFELVQSILFVWIFFSVVFFLPFWKSIRRQRQRGRW